MLTNPNTLGLFEEQLVEVTDAVHARRRPGLRRRRQPERDSGRGQAGRHGLRRAAHQRPQDLLHAARRRAARAPGPVVVDERARAVPARAGRRAARRRQLRARLRSARRSSAGCTRFHGHFGMLARALDLYSHARRRRACARSAQTAVLNANYLRALLQDVYDLAYDRTACTSSCSPASRQKTARRAYARHRQAADRLRLSIRRRSTSR